MNRVWSRARELWSRLVTTKPDPEEPCTCGYPLRGITLRNCPECGRYIEGGMRSLLNHLGDTCDRGTGGSQNWRARSDGQRRGQQNPPDAVESISDP